MTEMERKVSQAAPAGPDVNQAAITPGAERNVRPAYQPPSAFACLSGLHPLPSSSVTAAPQQRPERPEPLTSLDRRKIFERVLGPDELKLVQV